MTDQTLEKQVARIIELLTRGEYSLVESITRGERLSAQEIATAIGEYGRTLVSPPKGAYDQLLHVVEITGANTPAWYVNMPLWTREEGRSDLTLELTIREGDEGLVIELDDIHVL